MTEESQTPTPVETARSQGVAKTVVGLALLTTAAVGYYAWAKEDPKPVPDRVAAPQTMIAWDQQVSHRAVYRLKLASGSASSRDSFARADGRFVLEWEKACVGVTQNQRMVMEFLPFEGEPLLVDTRFSSWETADGNSMRFVSENRINGEVDEAASGMADRLTEELRFSGTKEETALDLPAETVFPTELTSLILQAAAAEESSIQHLVYDGTEDGTVMRVTAFVGNERGAESKGEVDQDAGDLDAGKTATIDKVQAALMALSSWPVTMAYFDPDATESLPDVQVSFRLYANGISDEITLDYGTFALAGELTELEIYEDPVCAQAETNE